MKNLIFAVAAALLAYGCSKPDDSTLKMITEATFPPYEFMRGHEIVGIDFEICRAVAAKLGKAFACETVDFDSVIPAVVSGKADLAAAGITEYRGFDLIAVPTILIEKPLTLVGMGDTISSLSLVGAR